MRPPEGRLLQEDSSVEVDAHISLHVLRAVTQHLCEEDFQIKLTMGIHVRENKCTGVVINLKGFAA